jgi:trigger factor
MKVDVEQVATCVRRLTVEIPTDRVNRELEAVYRNLQQRIKLPGFRPGRVPRRLLEHHYRQTVEQEVLQKLLPEALSEVLTKANLRAVGDPQIDQMTLTPGQPLRFVATTHIIPDFEVADYRHWQFERRIPLETDADIDVAVERVRERHAALHTVTGRPVQAEDFVIIDYQGFLDGRPLAGVQGTSVLVEVGARAYLVEIEQGLIGMVQGEEKTIVVQLPEDSGTPALAGKTVQFRVRIAEIKEKILPTLDDDFVREYEDADSLGALRERVRGELQEANRHTADDTLRREILARLVAENPVEVPEVLVNEQMVRSYLQLKRRETGRELTEADYQVDLESLRETFAGPALEAVRGQLILQHIGAAAGITVTPEEVDTEIVSLASRAAQNPEALKKALERNGSLSALEGSLRERKIFETIITTVQVTDKLVRVEPVAPTT